MAKNNKNIPVISTKNEMFIIIDKETGHEVVGVSSSSKESLQQFIEHYSKNIQGYLKHKDSMSFLSSLMAYGHIHPSIKDARATIDVWHKKGVILS